VNEAYEVLGDETKRKNYDLYGDPRGPQYSQAGPQGGQQRPGGAQSYHFEGDPSQFFGEGADFEDIFGSLFGNAGGRKGGSRNGHNGRGTDLQAEMTITPEEAYHGAAKVFGINNSNLRIRLKPGTYEGLQVKLPGKAGPGSGKAPAGDLYITIHIAPDARYDISGENIRQRIPIDLFTAVLGGDHEVHTLAGTLKIKIPPGTQNGKIMRIKGKGMPVYNKTDEFGDLFLDIYVQIPEELTEEQKKLFRQLQASFTKTHKSQPYA
jgi:curved DNA-binding protein